MVKGKCINCVYSGCEPTLWVKNRKLAWPATRTCVNHPDAPGEMVQVMPSESCRNFRPRPQGPVRLSPPSPPKEGLRYIALTKGKFATVDAADYEWLIQFRWHATGTHGRYYAATVIDGKSISMHRMIMNPPPGKVTDHMDGNGLNNSRANMRNCTPQQNRYNQRPLRRKASQYIGVFRRGDKWYAKITHNRKCHFLGPFDTEVEAAKARDKKAIELRGQYAWLNFPPETG
jgi:hypothetical protein